MVRVRLRADPFAELDTRRRVALMSSLRDWILELPGQGRFTFTTAEARARQAGVSAAATAAALERAKADHIIVSPVRGFHVVLPLEDRAAGAPSWRLFLDSLMTYLDTPYYVGLLTAAAIHGASPQAAQAVQVVTPRARRPIRVGRLAIVFVVRRSAAQAPVEQVKTPSGRIRVASPELVGLDSSATRPAPAASTTFSPSCGTCLRRCEGRGCGRHSWSSHRRRISSASRSFSGASTLTTSRL